MSNEQGLTLLEIIITFVLAALLGSMLVEYMGTSLTRGGEAVVMVQDGFSLNSVMEKITADYEDKFKKGSYDFSTFKSNIEGGNISTNNPYYGNYTVVTSYITFDGSGIETADTSGNNTLLKVTTTANNQSLTALFRR
jgi:type II secretory pathway pseudopilin PulG